MYSQPWSPTPSTTAVAPLFRTAKRSPPLPLKKALPLVAPYSAVLPTMMLFSAGKSTPRGGADGQDAARHALADVVVGIALEVERHTARDERPEALAGRAREAQVDRAFGQAVLAEAACDLAAQHAADGAVHVAHRHVDAHRLAPLEGGLGSLESTSRRARCSSRGLAPIVLLMPTPGFASAFISTSEKSSLEAFQCLMSVRVRMRSTCPTISWMVRKPSCAMISRVSSATKNMKFTTCSGWAVELCTQDRVLRGDADRTGVEVAFAHHDAAGRHQRRGREAELFCA